MKSSQHEFTIVNAVRELRPGGGVCGVADALASAFAAKGYRTAEFTLKDIGIHRSNIQNPNLFIRRAQLLFDVVYTSLFGSFMGWLKHRKDAVISHNDFIFGPIYVNHGVHKDMLSRSGNKWAMLIRNPIHLFLYLRETLRFFFPIHRFIVCFSKFEAEAFERYFPRCKGRIRVIPNGVNLARFKFDFTLRNEFRQRNGYQDTDLVLVFVGHEYERKGLYQVVEALPQVATRVKLVVVGGSVHEIEKAKSLATRFSVADRINFLGTIRNPEAIYPGCEALILPSSYEAWPLVSLEAMACGLPVLITAVGGVPEFVKEGMNGGFITRSPDNIAQKISEWESRDAHLEMRERALDTARSYSWDSVADRYLDLVQELQRSGYE